MRYYFRLALGLTAIAVVLGGVQLSRAWGKTDITIPLKTLNQEIAPAAISCPLPYYERGTHARCLLEGPERFGTIDLLVTDTAVAYADPLMAASAIAAVTAN